MRNTWIHLVRQLALISGIKFVQSDACAAERKLERVKSEQGKPTIRRSPSPPKHQPPRRPRSPDHLSIGSSISDSDHDDDPEDQADADDDVDGDTGTPAEGDEPSTSKLGLPDESDAPHSPSDDPKQPLLAQPKIFLPKPRLISTDSTSSKVKFSPRVRVKSGMRIPSAQRITSISTAGGEPGDRFGINGTGYSASNTHTETTSLASSASMSLINTPPQSWLFPQLHKYNDSSPLSINTDPAYSSSLSGHHRSTSSTDYFSYGACDDSLPSPNRPSYPSTPRRGSLTPRDPDIERLSADAARKRAEIWAQGMDGRKMGVGLGSGREWWVWGKGWVGGAWKGFMGFWCGYDDDD